MKLEGHIGIFQKMRIKNLRGSDLKKIDSFTLETSKNHLIRNFLPNGRVMVKQVDNFRKINKFSNNSPNFQVRLFDFLHLEYDVEKAK